MQQDGDAFDAALICIAREFGLCSWGWVEDAGGVAMWRGGHRATELRDGYVRDSPVRHETEFIVESCHLRHSLVGAAMITRAHRSRRGISFDLASNTVYCCLPDSVTGIFTAG